MTLRSARGRLADRAVRRRGALLGAPDPKPLRHTLDVYVAQATPAAAPKFTVVQPLGLRDRYLPARAPSSSCSSIRRTCRLPAGHVPFMGDYLDLAPAPAFVQGTNGQWSFNTRRPAARRARVLDRQSGRPAAGRRQLAELHAGDVGLGATRSIFDPNQIAPSVRGRPYRHAQPERLHRARDPGAVRRLPGQREAPGRSSARSSSRSRTRDRPRTATG